jgi:nucleotidyltransferase/DNA polymerase involved in DNA repair
MEMHEQDALRDLQRCPGIGPSLARDLVDLGIRSVDDLRNRDPEALYAEHCVRAGRTVDRCVLYAFRCAVYFAETADPDPSLLKWWNWKD